MSEVEYKQTPIGRIPKDWKFVKLIDAADYINGYAFSPKDWKNKGLPIIRIQNLNDPNAEFNYFDGKINNVYIVEKGDLLLSWSASIGVYIWNKGKAVLNQHIFKVIPKKGVDKLYLYYALFLAIEQLKKRIHGSTMKHFKRSELKITLIPLPPLPEQKAIAKILSTVDEAIQKVDEVIAKTERLKKGLMQKLLTRGIGHKEFKYSKELSCKIPKEWEVVKFKEVMIGAPQNGLYKNKKFYGSGFKIVRMTELFKGDILEAKDMERVNISDDELAKYSLNGGDLLFARRSLKVEGSGRCVLVPRVDEPILFESSIIRVRLNKEIAYPLFYLYYLNSIGRKQISRMIRTVAVSGITGKDLQNIKIPLPPFPEQQKIAEILSTVDKKLELERKRKEKLERIKKGLMNDLLTGRKRVNVRRVLVDRC